MMLTLLTALRGIQRRVTCYWGLLCGTLWRPSCYPGVLDVHTTSISKFQRSLDKVRDLSTLVTGGLSNPLSALWPPSHSNVYYSIATHQKLLSYTESGQTPSC